MENKRPEQNDEQAITWLAIGGNPRSGTTALGAALNRSASIRLFHEYDTHAFFSALEGFFSEQKRHQGYADYVRYEGIMPVAERDAAAMAGAIFQSVFGVTTPVIGTKFPGNHLWPPAAMPAGVIRKDIHITRNPLHTIYSVVEKMVHEGGAAHVAEEIERAIAYWISAWNHAVERFGSEGFYHVFYEDLDERHEEIAQDVADFLGIECDFSLESMKSRNREDIMTKLLEHGLLDRLAPIGRLFGKDGWPKQARQHLRYGVMAGFPLDADGVIDLREGRNGWKYIQKGFYAPEADGAWTRGANARVVFTPSGGCRGAGIEMEVIWSTDLMSYPGLVNIRVNGEKMASTRFILGEQSGRGRHYFFHLPNLVLGNDESVRIDIEIEEPVNPKQRGMSDDDRDLGIMIRTIRFSAL